MATDTPTPGPLECIEQEWHLWQVDVEKFASKSAEYLYALAEGHRTSSPSETVLV